MSFYWELDKVCLAINSLTLHASGKAEKSCEAGFVHSPLKQATFLQQFDSLWVRRECPQEEEVVLAECGEQAVTLQTALGLQP